MDPNTISLKVDTIGHVDEAAPDVLAKEQKEDDEKRIEELRKKDKKHKKKMRGRDKIGNRMKSGQR